MNALSQLASAEDFALAYRVRTPAPTRPTALLVLLHGVGGHETNLASLAADAPADTLVVLPRGRLELGPDRFAWFHVAFAADGPQIVASEAEASRVALIRFVAQLQAAYGIAAERSVIAGFSQGGILAASVGLSAPERVRGFAVLSGRILPELEPVLASRERLSRLHALIAHGRDDAKLPVAWAERADALLDRLGVPHALRLYPGGHGIAPQMTADFHAWLATLLPPSPQN
ncbi:alpha/beta hydrolase [Lysobacter silvisoli]|uniref:Phospholipase n=1 Tax=Lysobacter silvisoli TaxID=2293254 RepID=A0A371K479_9GAMM|nr:phospholipase [Lysobacter silvisoli]RDZ28672.1 phospholipase [Lysobacter silvisoli]